MIVDASAIVAILLGEPEADELNARLDAAVYAAIHPVSVYEATLAVARQSKRSMEQATTDVRDFLRESLVDIVPLDQQEAAAAVTAFERYGKGRHPAALNMGDCFSYGCARIRGMPLLYKGEDFARTDLA